MSPINSASNEGIQPADICGTADNSYIILAGREKYIRVGNLSNNDSEEFSISPSCRFGDHYLAADSDTFYVIKGNEYRRVDNINVDSQSVVYSLHANCQNGDFYFCLNTGFGPIKRSKFYIIFKDRGVYRRVSNMNTDADAVEYNLHTNCKDACHVWGRGSKFCFIKLSSSKWGFEVFETDNLNQCSKEKRSSLHTEFVQLLGLETIKCQ